MVSTGGQAGAQSSGTRIPDGLLRMVLVGATVIAFGFAALLPGIATIVGANAYRSSDSVLGDLAQRSTVFDTTGNVVAVLGTRNREDVALKDVPKTLQNAVVAVEDKSFWTNDGIDVNGMTRAFIQNVTSGHVQGGSTITQQLVKNRILTSKRTLERKLREIVLAMRLNEQYSKREILDQYLNTVYFGQGAYGAKVAAERFFTTQDPGSPTTRGKRLDELTLGESALLAGLISNPEGDNPFDNPQGARERRSIALGRMLDQGYITAAQVAAAEREPLPTVKPVADLRPRNAWAQQVQDSLFRDPMFQTLGTTERERRARVLTGGLKIYSTLDPSTQQAAQSAIDTILPEKPGFTGALLAMDPRDGKVRAMVAGPGFETSQYNIATTPPGRQAGSTWKTITLAAALENGFSPNDRVDGTSPCKFDQMGQTANAEPGGGMMTLRDATIHSVNCAFARTELAVGLDKVIPVAHALGITQQTLRPILTLTLGTIESTPLEMATVASTIADGGVHHAPTFVDKIVGPDGRVVFDSSNLQGNRAISADTAACEVDMLRGVISSGTGTAASLGQRPAFGKTGTTDDKADANFLGATPQLAAFIWHGNATARVPGAGFGGEIPARIFRAFMTSALALTPPLGFEPPGPACNRPGGTITVAGRASEAAGRAAPTGPALDAVPVPQGGPTGVTPTQPPPTTTPTLPPDTTPPTTTPPASP